MPAKKVEVRLKVDADLVATAKAKGLKLDEEFEYALRRLDCEDPKKRAAREKAWRRENRKATEASNRHLEKHGLWWEVMAREQLIAEGYRKTRKPHAR